MRVIKHLLIIVICVFGVMHTNTSFAYDDEGGESGGGETVQCNPGEMINSSNKCECDTNKGWENKEGTCKITCKAGYYLPSGGTECVSCVGNSGVAQNQYCPGGKFEYNKSKDEQLDTCAGNGHAKSDKTGCEIECAPGSYLKGNGTTCSQCEGPPYYCEGNTFDYPNSEDQGIKLCTDGKYVDNNNCNPCEGGNYCKNGVQMPCDGGVVYDSQTECIICSPGEYAEEQDSSYKCKTCEPGFYCTNSEKTECPDGTISRNTGWDTCVSCSDAGFVANDAHTECVPQFINGGTTWKFPDFMKIIH